MRRLYIALLMSAFIPAIAAAQSTSPIGAPVDPVRYVVAPETPNPGDRVTIEVQGVGTFLGDATLTWQQDGRTVLSGIGARNYSFTAGGLGSRTVIHLTIVSPTQGTIEHTFTFNPSAVNMLWEADTTIPPFYQGKALYSGGAVVTVAVFPQVVLQGKLVAPQALSYQWSLNSDRVPEQSGIGRSSFIFKGDQLKQEEQVSVDINLGDNTVAHGDLSIPATSPQVVLYQRDPLRGILFNAALPAQVNLLSKEITIQAEPYYFSSGSKSNGALTYAWTLNGNDASGPDTSKGILTLRQSADGSGTATVGVSAQNTSGSELVQAANASMAILFGQQGTSAFGL